MTSTNRSLAVTLISVFVVLLLLMVLLFWPGHGPDEDKGLVEAPPSTVLDGNNQSAVSTVIPPAEVPEAEADAETEEPGAEAGFLAELEKERREAQQVMAPLLDVEGLTEEEVVTIRGRVVEAITEQGIADFTLAIGYLPGLDDENKMVVPAKFEGAPITDENGEFVLLLNASAAKGGVMILASDSEEWISVARRSSVTLFDLVPGEMREVELVVGGIVALSGVVLMPSGEPAQQGVEISVACASANCVATRTDESGRFTAILMRGENVLITAELDGLTGSLNYVVPQTAPESPIEVVLGGAAGVRGRLVAGKRGVGGYETVVEPVIDGKATVTLKGEVLSNPTTTDAEGHFAIGHLVPGHYQISAHREYVPFQDIPSVASVRVHLQPEDIREVVLRVPDELVVFGRVTNEEKEPLANARVVVGHISGEGSHARGLEGTTDGNGQYAVFPIPEDATLTKLIVHAEDYEMLQRFDVALVGREIDVVLQRQGELPVLVVDGATRNPVSVFSHRSQRTLAGDQTEWESVNGAADGRATLQLPTGDHFVEIQAVVKGATLAAMVKVRVSPDSKEVPFELLPAGLVEGRVLAGEAPLPGREVLLRRETDPEQPYEPNRWTKVGSMLSEQDGAFCFAALSPGNYALGLAGSDPLAMRFTLDNGETRRLDMHVPQAITLVGTVFDGQGTRWKGESFRLLATPSERQPTGIRAVSFQRTLTTDEGGSFTISDFPLGAYEWMLEHSGRTRSTTNSIWAVDPGAQHTALSDFRREIILRGRMSINGKPWQGPPVEISHGNVKWQPGGRYEAEVKPSEPLEFAIQDQTIPSNPEWVLVRQEPLPPEPVEQELDIDLQLGELDILIELPPGETVPRNLQMTVLRRGTEPAGEAGQFIAFTATTPLTFYGPFAIPGRYRAEAYTYNKEWIGYSEVSEVRAGKMTTLQIRLHRRQDAPADVLEAEGEEW